MSASVEKTRRLLQKGVRYPLWRAARLIESSVTEKQGGIRLRPVIIVRVREVSALQ